MPLITFPDGRKQSFDAPITLAALAASISNHLAKTAIVGKVNNKLVDLFHVITEDSAITILTSHDPEGLMVLRHSAAHVLAQAVKTLFPTAQVTIGPVIENGFYYDFAFERAFSEHDLVAIEKQMQVIIKNNYTVSRQVVTREKAIQFFRDQGEQYKVEIIQSLPIDEPLTLYTQGEFTDLCRGPHAPSTGFVKAFKLTKVSGAYWRGNVNNAMLQRLYGTAWPDQASLKQYLHALEEAERRDHRKQAKLMDLFHFQEEAPGMVFWHANGWLIYQQIKQYIGKRLLEDGYTEVFTPQIVDLALWKQSGHWEMFNADMFTVTIDDKVYAVKPMNCPCHVQIFKQGLRSYRELPIRLAEFGVVHRNELSGAMHGLMRVRQMTQDDAHIFCMETQLQTEAIRFIRLLTRVYQDFGFDNFIVRLATRPEKRLGDDVLWDHAEGSLRDALRDLKLTFEERAGEGAFYGPKIEFHLKDCLGRLWQCGTLQLDYAQPERLEAYYIAEDGSKKTPVMLHRAILGSLERFIGILLEHYAGKLPTWLAPIQVVVMNITHQQAEFVEKINSYLQKAGIRSQLDLRNEKISFKIREHTLCHVPYLLIIGDRECESQMVTMRLRDGTDKGAMPIEKCIELIQADVAQLGRSSSGSH